MTRHKNPDSVIILDKKDHQQKRFQLPEGMRAVDIEYLDNEDTDILIELWHSGRRSREYYARMDKLNNIRRLKTRGFIEPIKKGSHYSYDISKAGIFLLRHALI